jgi:uncharacterized surface protein with fasciclin (FAS1) repeats
MLSLWVMVGLFLVALLSAPVSSAFSSSSASSVSFKEVLQNQPQATVTRIPFRALAEGISGDNNISNNEGNVLRDFLKTEYSAFYALLNLNPDIWKTLCPGQQQQACTLFAPTNAAFDKLGAKKLQQLKDVRNLETAQKMGLYHVVATEAVSAARLRTEDWTTPGGRKKGEPRPIKVQALVTLGGEVPVGRSRSGGVLFGMLGAKEDGDVVIGPDARIQKSFKIADGNVIVHEMDSLISPVILWRYCDQLRIPGF